MGHVVALEGANHSVLVKGVGVAHCPNVDDIIKNCLEPGGPPHFRDNLQGERTSIKHKANSHTADVRTPRPRCSEGLSSSPSMRTPTATSLTPKANILAKLDDEFNLYSTPTTTLGKRKARHSTPTPQPHPLSDILTSPFQPSPPSPGQPRKLFHSYSLSDDHVYPSSSSSTVSIPAKGRAFPSEFSYSEVVQIFEALEHLPPKVKKATRFTQITGLDYVTSTFNQAHRHWKAALQKERDDAEEDGGMKWCTWVLSIQRPDKERRRLQQLERRKKRREDRQRMIFKKCHEAPVVDSTTEEGSDAD